LAISKGIDLGTLSREKIDRYKANGLRAYNQKWPERYDSSAFIRFWISGYDQTVVSAIDGLDRNSRILDVGCATGRLLGTLASAGFGNLAGVDIAERIVSVSKRRLEQIGVLAELRVADAETGLPWCSSSFDIVTVTGVFHHFFRPEMAIQEISRVLSPGGKVVIVDPWFPPIVRHIINIALRVKPHSGDYRFYSPRGIIALFNRNGLETEWWRRAAIHSFVVAVRSPMSPTNEGLVTVPRHEARY
jgi:ubiquinone/menaquinone biosynthesis C-methylase UbiE